jgi:hypothetical protein
VTNPCSPPSLKNSSVAHGSASAILTDWYDPYVFVVALAELGTSAEDEAPPLAADLSTTVYEARLLLAAGVPCVVLSTPDRERALDLLRRLRERRHGAVAFDAHAVIPASSMVAVRRYRLEEDALELDSPENSPLSVARLPFAEMGALLRAMHKSSHEHHEDVKELKFRPGAAIATGGLVMTKVVSKKTRSIVEEREQVLYVFGKGGVPWLLRESTAQYAGLGEAMHPTRALNFAASIRMLRDRAPQAAYDERLLTVRKLPELPVDAGEPRGGDRSTSGVDLLAHVLALWFSRKSAEKG